MRRILCALMTLLLVASGCSSLPTRQTPPQPAAGEAGPATPGQTGPGGGQPADGPVTLRVFSQGVSGLDSAISAYQAKYQNVRIEKVGRDGDSRNTDEIIKDLVQQGKLDLAKVVGDDELVRAGVLMPLDPLIQRDRFDLKPYGPVIDQMRFEGKLYDLPTTFQTSVLLYNTELFKQAGLPAPKPGWTWEQFREAARTLTKGERDRKTWGFTAPLDEELMRAFLIDRTGRPYAPYPDADVEETLRFFSTLVWSDRSIKPSKPRDWAVHGFKLELPEFEQGRAGMSLLNILVLYSVVHYGDFRNTPWDVAPMPSATGAGLGPNTFIDSYGIAATTKQVDEAWRFLRFLAGEEGAVAMAQQGRVHLYRTPAAKKAWFDRQPTPPPGTELLFDTQWTISPREKESHGSNLYAPMHNAFNRMLTGKQTWEEAFAQYLQEAAPIKAEEQGP